MTRIHFALLTTLVGLGAAAPRAEAQLQASRPALDQLLVRLDAAAAARDSSPVARGRARTEAATVRARLSEGDFQPGDRVLIRVEATSALVARGAAAKPSVEEQLSDTFTVGINREVPLPVIGVVALRGLLRSELEAHLTSQIGRFIRKPVVHARAMIRISVMGAVANPGFYAVPTDAILSDVLMLAGGPAPDAKLRDLRIERAGERLWDGPRLQVALAEGRTLDAMNIRAGDQFVVPVPGRSTVYVTARTVAVILSIPITVYTLTRIF